MIVRLSKYKKVIRFLPILLLILILGFLGSINSRSEVYIDLSTDRMRFKAGVQSPDQPSIELMTGVLLDSLQLFNCSLELFAQDVQDSHGRSLKGASPFVEISRTTGKERSQIILSKIESLHLKSLFIPQNATVRLSKDDDYITVTIEVDDFTPSASRSLYGTIGVGGRFFLSGRNILLGGAGALEDYELITITTKERRHNIGFYANDEKMVLQLCIPASRMENSVPLIERLSADSISFATIEESRRRDRVISGIKGGKIQIAGIDFFGRLFLIKEVMLEQTDFLRIPAVEEYCIDHVEYDKEGLEVSLWNDSANELEKGKRSQLARSVFPSILEFVVAEPSKKTVWVIFVFLFTQGAVIYGAYRKTSGGETSCVK
ncbi:MAG: hypothetical protein JSW54_02480 [Fidelibacterota bacterium]|nr:MAG: hypothetical protein JSW54_02480 [Candidatus Neomarinimicrobiota bacterium]